jgi:hypothetical protein
LELLESSQCLARALDPQVCDTPLLRADVTRLGSLGNSSPLEDEGPLSSNYRLVQDPSDTRLPLRKVERLGQDVRRLVGRSDADQLHLAILDHFVNEMLPNVDVLSALTSTDDVVSPLDGVDARSVVLVHRSRAGLGKAQGLEKVAEVQDCRSLRRGGVVFCLSCRQRCGLLLLRAPR